ncbi:Protein of unknown function [Gryllus bimaculatus]|nr:Protein of unknown function [Gryllus bimaculatus]
MTTASLPPPRPPPPPPVRQPALPLAAAAAAAAATSAAPPVVAGSRDGSVCGAANREGRATRSCRTSATVRPPGDSALTLARGHLADAAASEDLPAGDREGERQRGHEVGGGDGGGGGAAAVRGGGAC